MSIHDLLNKMESAEQAFLETEFMAPVLPGGQVRVRIAGLVCSLRVAGRPEPGWAILVPEAMDRARIIAQPSLGQIRDYLALFPAVRLLLVARGGHPWLAIPAHRGDSRFQIEGVVRVRLVVGAEPFQRVVSRFDGTHFWFQEVDRRRSPAIAAYLREELDAGTTPEDLYKPTLTAEEREAYRLAQGGIEAILRAEEQKRRARAPRQDQQREPLVEIIRRDHVEKRLANALAHGGAELASYIEREGAYTVAYAVEGRQYRSTVSKNDLTVLSAGICLSGGDRSFDLQSLVGVLREGGRGGRLVRD